VYYHFYGNINKPNSTSSRKQ